MVGPRVWSRSIALAILALGVSVNALGQSLPSISERSQAQQLLREASRLVSNIPESQRTTAAANIAGQLARSGDWQGALATVRAMNPEDQPIAINSVAWALHQSGDTASAEKAIATIQGEYRDIGYVQLAHADVQQNRFNEAEQLMRRTSPTHPDWQVESLVSLARTTYPRDPAAARQMLKDARAIADRNQEGEMFGRMVLSLVRGYSRIGDTTTATQLLDNYDSQLRKLTTIPEIAVAFAQTGDYARAAGMAEGLQPAQSDFVFQMIAAQQSAHGDFTAAVQSVARMQDPAVRFGAAREVGLRAAAAGRVDDAMNMALAMPDLGQRANFLAHVALEEAQNGDAAAVTAAQMAEQLLANGASNTRLYPASEVREFLAVTYVVQEDFPHAMTMIQKLPVEDRQWPLWNLTNQLASRGQVQESLKLAEQQSDPYPRLYALVGTAQGLLDRAEKGSQ